MNIQNAFPSTTLKAADMEDADMTLTMTDVKIETVGQGKDAEDKPHLYFEETDKPLVLNKTNAGVISQLYGNDTDGWPGNKITLYATEVEFGGKMTMGIRVRLKKPGTGGGQQRQAPAARQPTRQPARGPRAVQQPEGDAQGYTGEGDDIPF